MAGLVSGLSAGAMPSRAGRFLPAALTIAALAAGAGAIFRGALASGVHADEGSSYRSTETGSRALFLLLPRLGFRVERLLRAPYLDDTGAEFLSLGRRRPFGSPRRRRADAEALARFVEKGGAVVWASLEEPVEILDALAGKPAGRPALSRKTEPEESGLETEKESGVEAIRLTDREGRALESRAVVFPRRIPRGAEPVVTGGPRVVGYRLVRARGSFTFIGAPDLFENAMIARAQNLEFVLALVEPNRRVVFDEYRHGFDAEQTIPGLLRRYGLGFLPLQTAVLLFGLALRSRSERASRVPAETVREGSRRDLLSAVGALAAARISDADAARAEIDAFRRRLASKRSPGARGELGALEAMLRDGASHRDIRKEIVRIETRKEHR